MVAYDNLIKTGELKKEYFNMSCPHVSSCPEGTNCTKSPVNCSRAREMSSLSEPDSGEYGLNLGGLESSLQDYFSSDTNYSEAGINYTEMVSGAGYQGRLVGAEEDNYSLSKSDTSTYQTVA